MARFSTSGFDDLSREFDRISRNASEIDGSHEYTFSELFPSDFMDEHTQFSEIYEFLTAAGLPEISEEAFDAMDEEQLDVFVKQNSAFSSWEEMRTTAAHDLISRKLFE